MKRQSKNAEHIIAAAYSTSTAIPITALMTALVCMD
jgi:hypothetical protein